MPDKQTCLINKNACCTNISDQQTYLMNKKNMPDKQTFPDKQTCPINKHT